MAAWGLRKASKPSPPHSGRPPASGSLTRRKAADSEMLDGDRAVLASQSMEPPPVGTVKRRPPCQAVWAVSTGSRDTDLVLAATQTLGRPPCPPYRGRGGALRGQPLPESTRLAEVPAGTPGCPAGPASPPWEALQACPVPFSKGPGPPVSQREARMPSDPLLHV